MPCRFCGGINPETANYCGNCGKLLRQPLPYRPGMRRIGVKAAIFMLLLLSLAAYFSYLIFEPYTFEPGGKSESLKKEIEIIKKSSAAGKTVDFQFIVSPEDLDGYINEEFLKKNASRFKAMHTELRDREIEIALSTEVLHLTTRFRIRIRPEVRGDEVKFCISGVSLGRLPLLPVTYKFLYGRHPFLEPQYLLERLGIKFKEVRVEKDRIFLKGVWSI